MSRLETPVALILFNRPEETRKVFDQIARVRPTRLFLIADGPREDVPNDAQLCKEARSVVNRVDWECEVHTRFSDENLGCGYGPATGISWVFDHVEEAIILEDDCLAHTSFFWFCSELLERYRNEEKVMLISGSNFIKPVTNQDHSYIFLQASGMCFWGWATWRRAWQHHDMKAHHWSTLRETDFLEQLYPEEHGREQWRLIFDSALEAQGEVDYWDYQWTLAVWSRNGVAISPRVNLVSNIGFGTIGTHTTSASHPWAKFPAEEIEFPLTHPETIVPDPREEIHRLQHARAQLGQQTASRSFSSRLMNAVKRRLSRYLRREGPLS